MTDYPKVEVLWFDANTESGWVSQETAQELQLQICRSLGYLIVKDEIRTVIVQSLQEGNTDVGDAICIPTSCIEEISYEAFKKQN